MPARIPDARRQAGDENQAEGERANPADEHHRHDHGEVEAVEFGGGAPTGHDDGPSMDDGAAPGPGHGQYAPT